jgi:[ribosomal protein S5]-alanine N-acetyltransferase
MRETARSMEAGDMRTRRRASAGIERRFGALNSGPLCAAPREELSGTSKVDGMPVSIAGRACRLRAWFASDAEALVPLANDPYIARYLSHVFPQPYTRADADRWIREQGNTETVGQFAIEVGSELAGGIGFIIGSGERIGTASLGYWLGRRYWGKGVMSEAVQAATKWAFETLRVRRIWANVMGPNVASMRVLEKAGYQLEGKMNLAICDRRGIIHDELIYAKMRPN